MNIIKTLKNLFRLKPVLAWTVTSFILVLSAGIHDGLIPNYWLAMISIFVPLLLQGVVSHAINDIVDENVDRSTDMEGTKRIKVLISGIASKKDLWFLSLISIFICMLIVLYLYTIRGFIIPLILSGGIFMIYLYNFKPIKLNYRPFGDYTVVLPVILLISCGFSYVIFGTLSESILVVSIINAIMNMAWYQFSRLQDVWPDYKHGKMTTFASILKKYDDDFDRFYKDSMGYLSWSFLILMAYILFITAVFMINCIIPLILLWIFAGNMVTFIKSGHFRDFYNISITSAYLRSFGMYITYINCVLLSLSLIVFK